MKLSKDESEKMKSAIIKRGVKIWVIAFFVTITVIGLQATFFKWLVGFIGMHITIGMAVVGVIITNFIMGVYKGLSVYGEIKKTIKKSC